MSLYHGEKVYGAHNFHELIGDGKEVFAGGEKRLLSAIPRPASKPFGSFAKPFSSVHPRIPRSEWSRLLKEQIARKARVSDHQNFPPYDQDGLPTCWANGPAGAFSTARVIIGLPYVQVSACSLAVPISGGHQGGFEGDAIKYLAEHGGASVDVWPNNETDASLNKRPEVEESRKNHVALEFYDCENDDDYATAAILGFPMAVAYNFWSHVVQVVDLVEISPGKFGFRIRNNWGAWGSKNDHGQPGYAVMELPHGSPSSGFAIKLVTPSQK